MNDADHKFDNLLKSHLAGRLDRHVGRAQRAFTAEVLRPEQRSIQRYWAAAAVLLIAASIAATLLVRNLLRQPLAGKSDYDTTLTPEPPPLMPIAQSVSWQTVDDGTVMLNGDLPIRQVRRRVIERTRWYDAQRKTTIELAVPQEQVMFISH